ncbi:Type IV secretory pathway, VirD4 component, TraG/TraD family ATPase [Cryobacterium flavum]|uniref:Conjugal transfer protein n=1 Tax=Cryobacterium flavum TaxID=1424659 RepID=A0A4R8UYR9_9MICO|nr:TraM recognition domain-containing protein [Cryobacterium flavum]TFB73606.1 conjugal transfer protein [Cryobacterium flavum]SDO33090.1 Type IV secretory pathway, VirD4 component, TraG/TraD family ATPase [Cryobacterium flavum]
MSASNRRNQPGVDGQTIMLIVCLALVAVALGAVWVAVTWGSQLDGVNSDLTGDPFGLFFGVLGGSVIWPASGTWILAATLVAVLVLGVLVAVSVSRARRRRSNVDGAATYMGKGRDLRALSATGAKATAQRLGVTDWLGVPIGITVAGRHMLYGSPEDMHVDIWGPRTGKSTSRAIPAILSAPGAVLTTSNKRDVLDATRDVRAAGGGRVWAFDPQRIALEEPTWWWNPLSYVTDDVKAAKLAEHFATGSRAGDSRADPYFDNAGQDLLAGFLLAAAVANLPITKVFTWTTTPGDEAPVDILRAHGYDQMADAVDGQVNGEPRRRDSVYGTAAQMASCLKVRAIGQWVTPIGGNLAGDSRPQFDPHAFVRSRDTLYSLSKEGKGTAGPLVTALTAATVEAAEELATTQPGGRLAVPLLGVLDEAANVCRWHGLPDLYSHYGSRGIVLMTILQSWSQGVEVWGRDGMRKLWSASNIAVYGGGVKEPEFLGELSQMVGDYDKHTTSTSVGRGNRSTSHQVQRERTLDVADLGALPRGRAVVFASGAPATLIETVPWMRSSHANAVRASIAAHDPSSRTAPVNELPVPAAPAGDTHASLNAAPRQEDDL